MGDINYDLSMSTIANAETDIMSKHPIQNYFLIHVQNDNK